MVIHTAVLSRLRRLIGNDHLILVFLALIAGTLAGSAVVLFRELISLVQTILYGSGSERLFANADVLQWWQILLAPVGGGLVVGGLVHFLLPHKRPEGVADVIEASALKGGRMSLRSGLAAATSAISIGTGASVSREGPAVHLGASLAGWIGRRLHLSRSQTRTLLGCGVAAAIAALDLIEDHPDYAALPLKKAKAFTEALGLAEAESAIVPIVIGEAVATLEAAKMLEDEGYLVVPIRPPTVPEGTARLRVTFTAAHDDDDIARLAERIKPLIIDAP